MLITYDDYISNHAFEDFYGYGPINSTRHYYLNNRRYYVSYDFKNKPFKKCIYCKHKMKIIYDFSDTNKYLSNYKKTHRVIECLYCGWWEYQHCFYKTNKWDSEWDQYVGIVKKFDIKNNQIPVEILNKEIIKKPNLLHNITGLSFERLVQDVFKDFYNCEVTHCGKSHDGGIDLIMLDSDKPTLIQVKNRISSTKTEPVSSIRDFLGAMIINGSKKGIYVSSAKKYSDYTIKIKKDILIKNIVERFELINFNNFIDMLRLVNRNENNKKWKELYDEKKLFSRW